LKYLIDTNIFIHTINSNIYAVAAKCNDIGSKMYITPTIIDELSPGYKLTEITKQEAQEILNCVTTMTKSPFNLIDIVSLDSVDGARQIYKSLRDGFYSWIYKTDYLHLMIQQGKLLPEDIKTLKYRDIGECELLAMAKASKGAYLLITNDQGRVYKHPYINIFEKFQYDDDVIIIRGAEWIDNIGYIPE
jgi:predicted nucleic acid-binding protein